MAALVRAYGEPPPAGPGEVQRFMHFLLQIKYLAAIHLDILSRPLSTGHLFILVPFHLIILNIGSMHTIHPRPLPLLFPSIPATL